MAKLRYLGTVISDFITGQEYDYALDNNERNRDNFDHNLYIVVNGRAFKVRPESCGPNEVSYLGTNRVDNIPIHRIPIHQPSPSTSIVANWFEYNGPTHDEDGVSLDTIKLLVYRYALGVHVHLETGIKVHLRRLPS